MHDLVLLPMAYTIAKKNSRQVEEKARSMRDLFTKATDIVLSRMHEDIVEIKKSLKRANITVITGERIDGVASYSYKCCNHNGAFAITREYAKRSHRQDDRTIYKWIILNTNKAVLKVAQLYLL
ncbi:hypothetical protein [Paenibacillus sp. MMO-58]|uniref:hypothetical protein n=1 Tax=Paenibacillus sp. MMO-58 TaxID=3081290 RepID=UPI0030185714